MRKPPELARPAPLILRVCDGRAPIYHGAALEPDAADGVPEPRRDGLSFEVSPVYRRAAERDREPVHVPLELEDLAGIARAKPDRVLNSFSKTSSSSAS